MHKDIALAGFDAISRRPKHHLIASMLWLIDFTYRKTYRKADAFLGDRSANVEETREAVEAEYDEILDILKGSLLENYRKGGKAAKGGKGGRNKTPDKKLANEINRDFLDLVGIKEGGYETAFERHMKEKMAREETKLKRVKQQLEEEKRW